MDETAMTKPDWLNNHVKVAGERGEEGGGDEDRDEDSASDEECDAEAWDALSRSFRQAQSVLDQNCALIQQVNDNHESKIPDNILKNVALIHQINGNISKVLSIYSDLSINFSNIVHQRRMTAATTDDGQDRGSDGDDEVESRGDSAEHAPEKSQ